jgi:phosphoglycolate phosphatase
MSAPLDLIFDLDGTLTDPREGIARCFVHSLEKLGLPAPNPQLLDRHIGPPLREAFAQLLATSDTARIELAVSLYRERFGTLGLFENVPYPEIDAALELLRARGHTLWVCTSKAHVYATRILEHFRLSDHIVRVYGAELDGSFSDKAELLAHLLQRETIAPRRAIMIGDRMHDMRAARLNQVASVGVLYGFGGERELTAAGADALCAQVTDLPAVIAQVATRL